MLPYLMLQLLYAFLSGLLVLGLLMLSSRLEFLLARPLIRLLAIQAVVGVLCLAAFPIISRLHDVSGAFAAVAFAFYSAAIWAPLLVTGAAIRGARKGRPGRPYAVAALSVLCVLVAAHAMFVEPNRIVTREETIGTARWPGGLPAFRIVHISDLQSVGENERERRAARMVNALEPDLIVITGDYFAGPFWNPEPAMDAARVFLSSLRSKHGVIAVAGHSEPGRLRARLFADLDTVYLENDGTLIDLGDGRTVSLYSPDAEYPALPALFTRAPGRLNVVLSHVPGITRDLTGRGVDIHLAGHTHGGQVCLPLVGAPVTLSALPRKYARGLFRFDDHWLNVSAGLGMEGNHAPRVRFLCPPEICVIDVAGTGPVPRAGSAEPQPR